MANAAAEYKIILLGDAGVGKTTLFLRVKCQRFIDTSIDSTFLGCDQYVYEYPLDGATVKVSLWDTGGTERYKSLWPSYFHGAHAAILCYSLVEKSSLDHLHYWHSIGEDSLRKSSHEKEQFVWAVAGNKMDRSDTEMPHESITQVCRDIGTDLSFFISAKTGVNVQHTMGKIIGVVHKKRLQAPPATDCSIKIGYQSTRKKSSCCGTGSV